MCSEYKQTLNDIVRKLYMFKFKFNQITKNYSLSILRIKYLWNVIISVQQM